MYSIAEIELLFHQPTASKKFHYLLLLLITFCATLAAGDQLIQCKSNNSSDLCLNNGTCLLTSRSAAYQLCRDDEAYFSGNCYKVIKKLETWQEASELCQERDGDLITIENELQRLFISDYLQSSLATDTSNYNVAVWTAGLALPNGTQVVYVWAPNNYIVEGNFWHEGQPPIQGFESCIKLDSSSLFRNWTTANCSDEYYFVCSRPVDKETNELEHIQCMCHDGYRGSYCDKSFSVPGITLQSQSVACIDTPFEFSCPSGDTISVDFAAYGNIGESYELCLNSPQIETNATDWEVCIHPSSLQTMISVCQGLTYCRIGDIQSLFPDNPCLPITPITLQYRMRCLKDPLLKCPLNAIYQNGRCYVPYIMDEPLSLFDAQTRCRKEGGQMASSVGQTAQNEIIASIRKRARRDDNSCYWMGTLERTRGSTFCECYYVTNVTVFWSPRNCDSKEQWVCEFAPEADDLRPTEIYNKRVEQRVIFGGHSESSTASGLFVFDGSQHSSTTEISDDDGAINSRAKHSFCKEYKWNGITIPRTLACSDAQTPCPDPERIIGIITQRCNCETSEWEKEPSTTNCTHKWVAVLDQLIDNDAPAEDISRQWAQMLLNSSEQTLYGGDVVHSIDIGEKLLSLARVQYAVLDDRNERSEKATEFTQMYGEAGNELLSDHVTTVWMTLPDHVRISKASVLMSNLQQSAALMAEFIIQKQKKIDYSNWALEVQVKKPVPITLGPLGSSPTMADDVPPEITPRSHGFASIPSADTSAGHQVAAAPAAAIAPAAATASVEPNISFSSFSLSPVLSMPPLSILQQSTQPASPAVGQSSPFDDFASVARPRSRFMSLNRNPLRLGYYIFKSVGALLNTNETTFINSLVIGASVNDPMSSVSLPKSDPVTFKFYHIRSDGVTNPRCVFWDTANNIWSEEGCTMLRTSNGSTDCSCTHLTCFAILMDIDGSYRFDDNSVANQVLNLITIVGCAFSIACLFLAFLVFTCFRSLWSIRHTIHRNLCFCLLLAELVFVVGIDRTENKVVCRAIAVALHYLFLAAFSWMLLEGYQLYLMLIQVFETDEVKVVLYYLYAYGFPAVIVAVTAGVAWQNYSTNQYCWLNVETPTIWAFAGPIAVVIVSNIVFLGVALRVVLSVRSRDRTRAEQMLGWLKGSATLLCLLGITWLFGYLMVIQGTQTVFAYIFTILNCLQGVFIFVIHVILNDKVRMTLLRFLRVHMCCMADPGPANAQSVISSRQKLMKMMKNGDLSGASSQPSSDLKSIKSNKKGMLVVKAPSGLNGTGSPSTMITYLDWKTKVINRSGSIPSNDSGYDCETREARSISDEIEMNKDLSLKDSSAGSERHALPTRRKINKDNDNGSKPEPNWTSDKSTIVERF